VGFFVYPLFFLLVSTYLYYMEKIQVRKKEKCLCQNCGIEFNKDLSEIKRNQKLNRPNFCGRKCSGKHNSKNLGEHLCDYKKIIGYKRSGDELSVFRYHFRNIKKRNKEINITIYDLKEQWDLQNGICIFSGIKLDISSKNKNRDKNPIYLASLDRINSEKGYVKDNIRWVSRPINWMKNEMNDESVIELINILIENNKKTHN
jgi:hypothetical protein